MHYLYFVRGAQLAEYVANWRDLPGLVLEALCSPMGRL